MTIKRESKISLISVFLILIVISALFLPVLGAEFSVTSPISLEYTNSPLAQSGSMILSSPALSGSVVYLGSTDHNIYALSALTGETIWQYQTAGNVTSSPAVKGGVVYAGSADKNVYALSALTGTKIWQFLTGGSVQSSPSESGGVVYAGSNDGKLYALSADTGVKIWEYQTGGVISSSPAVADNIVYIGSNDSKIYALSAGTGEKLWDYQTGGGITSSPAVWNGTVYIGSDDSKVYALSADSGVKLWEYQTGLWVTSSPTVANGVVYIGSWDNKIYALSADTGEKLWDFQTGGPISSSPVIANGVVYLKSSDTKAYALSADTGAKIWEYSTGVSAGSSPAVANGVVYITGDDSIIALGGAGSPAQPIAGFSATPTSGTAPLSVQFTDSSTNSPTSWSWTFGDGETSITQNPSHTYINPGTYSVSLTATNAAGSDTQTKTGYINVTSPDTGNNLPLHPGWNFISVPKTLEDGYNTPIWLDQYVDPEAHSMWGFNGETASWVQMTAEDPIIPLDGYWLWNGEETTVPLTFKDMGQQLPPTKNLFSGWNAIGFTATVPATARDTLLSVQDIWVSAIGFDGLNQRYENGIINGGSGLFADTRDMYPGHGYWLYMDDNGILSPLSG